MPNSGSPVQENTPNEKLESSSFPLQISDSSWQGKLSALRGSGIVLDLPTLIALARTHELSDVELESIRKAWVVRELQTQQPQLKKHRAEALYEEARKKLGFAP
jgi:hypothetical protein